MEIEFVYEIIQGGVKHEQESITRVHNQSPVQQFVVKDEGKN